MSTQTRDPGKLPLIFILLTMVIDAMGIGLIMPVMPDLLQEVSGGDLSMAAEWGGVLTAAFAVMQFLCGPLVGNLSDRFGRRPILLASLLILALDYLVMAVAGALWLLLIGRIVGGIASSTHSTANAYVADISKPEEKAARFGLIGAAFGIGFVFGPMIGGLLAEFGTRAPFFAAAALAMTNLVFGLFVLPETLKPKNRRPFLWRRANPLGAFAAVSALPEVRRPLAITLFYSIAFWVYPSVWSYFTQARFGWDPTMIGISLAAFGITSAIVQGGLIRIVLRKLGERGTVIYGLAFNCLSFLAIALVTSPTIALILTPLSALGSVVTPALQGMMSRAVSDDAQGELQGVLTSINAIAMIISPLLMTQVFAAYTSSAAPFYFPGAPFIVSLGLMIVCLGLFVTAPRRVPA